MKKVLPPLMCIALLLVTVGCATNVRVSQPLPDGYKDQCAVESYEVTYKQGVAVPSKLKTMIARYMDAGLAEMNGRASSKTVDLAIEIDKARIANRIATLFIGAFAGANSLYGAVIVRDRQTQDVVGQYRVDVDRNYGGFSIHFDLEEKVAKEFAAKIIDQLSTTQTPNQTIDEPE